MKMVNLYVNECCLAIYGCERIDGEAGCIKYEDKLRRRLIYA